MKRGLIIFIFFVLSISYISAAVTFPASNVKLNVAGSSMTLQQAADGGYLRGLSSYASSASILMGDHDASQIWVSVNGAEKTLLNALSTVNGLCGSGSYSTYSGAVPNPGHVATEVQITVSGSSMTLQAAINTGKFCTTCAPGATQKCGIDTSCTTYPTITCTASGTWPACNPTYVAWGTDCTDSSHSCDGAGNCLGWSGNGCGSCPLGSFSSGGWDYCSACPAGQVSSSGLPYCTSPYPYEWQSSYNNNVGSSNWYNGNIAGTYYMLVCDNPGDCTCSLGICSCGSTTEYSWKIKP